ncbi:MAG: hypothetical protein IPN34_10260 [Planctomycetes bacterium]|nr:hypothetical protein [Planctomycetota bacterium]
MSSLAWAGLALLGLAFGTGALLIHHIFADDVEAADEGMRTSRYGVLSAPALALALTGAGAAGAWIAARAEEHPWLVALGIAAAAASFVAIGLPIVNHVLARRAR